MKLSTISKKIFVSLHNEVYFRLQSFQRKHDIIAILLVFDSRGMPDSGPGYCHPNREIDSTTEDFSMVVSVPHVSPL